MEGKSPYTSELVSFAGALEEHGVRVSPDDVIGAARALTVVDPLDRDQFYHALRACLVDDPEEIPVFDEVFDGFWRDRSPDDELGDSPFAEGGGTVADPGAQPGSAEADDGRDAPADDGPGSDGGRDGSSRPRRRTDAGEDRHLKGMEEIAMEIGQQEATTDVDVSVDDRAHEVETLSLLVTELGRQIGSIRGFRRRRHPAGDVDLRKSLDMAREQTPDDLPRTEADRSRAKVRFFVDVSNSMLQNMDQVFLLLFLFECVRQFADVRVFMFDTSVTEVTRHFRTADVMQTLAEMRAAQTEWGAGTTVGACLAEIRAVDPFVVDRETVTIVVSDGWDAGDIELLTEQMRHLERQSRSVIWLNPRAVAPEYEPKVSGIAAAMPYVDHFFGFATSDDLRSMVEHLRSNAAVQ